MVKQLQGPGNAGGPNEGGATGVIAFEAEDAGDVIPYVVVAVTVNVYETPLLNPDTTIGDPEPEAI